MPRSRDLVLLADCADFSVRGSLLFVEDGVIPPNSWTTETEGRLCKSEISEHKINLHLRPIMTRIPIFDS